jgi:hypothetical protein
MRMGTRPLTPSTTLATSGSRCRGGMQSTSRTTPSGVWNSVSRISESPW